MLLADLEHASEIKVGEARLRGLDAAKSRLASMTTAML
jgi:hypothetical protein